MQFSCFPVLPDSTEAQVILGDTVKFLLIAYTLSVTFLPKKISKSVHVCQSHSKPKVGRFLRHGVDLLSRVCLSVTLRCTVFLLWRLQYI